MITELVFYLIAALMVASSLAMIVTSNPAKAALCLALTFFLSSFMWILLHAEFLALSLIFVYVGAVMTLFLFVIMMLNINFVTMKKSFVRFMPLAALIMMILVAVMIHAVNAGNLVIVRQVVLSEPAQSNTAQLGSLLYGPYLFSFELAAIILLIAIVGSIALVFTGKRVDTKSQSINEQHSANKSDRLRVLGNASFKVNRGR